MERRNGWFSTLDLVLILHLEILLIVERLCFVCQEGAYVMGCEPRVLMSEDLREVRTAGEDIHVCSVAMFRPLPAGPANCMTMFRTTVSQQRQGTRTGCSLVVIVSACVANGKLCTMRHEV